MIQMNQMWKMDRKLICKSYDFNHVSGFKLWKDTNRKMEELKAAIRPGVEFWV